ncbi:MAG TPA: BldC family transcriptional regulator [Acidimicrobiales bacterium]|nr:BldC family transcriptional regulator [Acidimicrobiales bacterium]HVV36284.1 BldC family transcriptional regulator [Acidimicrobiales bacterium]
MTISVESDLLTPAEVATLFRVSPKTVTRWARSGKLTALRTLGGHRRFRASEVKELLERFEDVGTDLA